MSEKSWWLPVLILSLGWSLAFSTLTAGAASLNLASAGFASAELRTLPMAIMTLGSGFYNLALPLEIKRLGRWRSYLLGALVGLLGSVLCAFACELRSLALLAVGAAFAGIGLSHAQNYRFGATLCVPDASKAPIAISWVLAGGIIGAVVGPEYSKHTRDSLPSPFSGVFATSAGAYALLFLLLLAGRNPLTPLHRAPAAAGAATERRPLKTVFAQPRCAAATFVGATSYASMVFLMAALPLAMNQDSFSFADSSTAIQVHMVLMFMPSFGTGHAIKKLGVVAVMLTGAALLAIGGAIMLLLPASLAGYFSSQGLIGWGWNFTYIAASAGLQQQTRPAERVVAQAANDLTVFGLSGVVSMLAAVALSGLGWPGMQYVMFGVSGAIVLVVGGAEALARRGAASSVELTPV